MFHSQFLLAGVLQLLELLLIGCRVNTFQSSPALACPAAAVELLLHILFLHILVFLSFPAPAAGFLPQRLHNNHTKLYKQYTIVY